MRTTLNLDDRVLAAARSRARNRGISLGDAVSELALSGYQAEAATTPLSQDAFPTLPPVAGHVITNEMVDAALAED